MGTKVAGQCQPYYQDKLVTIYHGDWRELIGDLQAGRPPLVDVGDVECLLTQQAYTREGLEARLGASWNTIYVACRRAGRQDLTDQIVTHTPGAVDRCPQVADRVKARAS